MVTGRREPRTFEVRWGVAIVTTAVITDDPLRDSSPRRPRAPSHLPPPGGGGGGVVSAEGHCDDRGSSMTAHDLPAAPRVVGNGGGPPGLRNRPPCMMPGELARWSEANLLFVGSRRALSPCLDCTPTFAVEMRLEGRCNGTPCGRAGLRRPCPARPHDRPGLRNRRDGRTSASGRRMTRPTPHELGASGPRRVQASACDQQTLGDCPRKLSTPARSTASACSI